jgi:hypothetical protein
VTILLIVILVLLLAGGIPAWNRREDWGQAPSGVIGLLLLIVLVILIFRLI